MSGLPELSELSTPAGIGKFNGYLTFKSYISGYTPTQEDVKVFAALKDNAPDEKKATHAFRWYKHIASFTESERKSWPKAGDVIEVSVPAPAAPEKVETAKAAEEDPFGGDDDLFAEDGGDTEAAAALQERLKKEAKDRAAQKLKNARSLIVLEVKPYEADFDLETLALSIKSIEHEGIQNWGAEHRLEPVAFGIKKLVVSVVVYDDLIGVDDISDLIMEKHEDDVQSIDVQAMSKV